MAMNPDEIGALWEKKDKNGGTYLSGKIRGESVVLFPVREKANEKQPDWRVKLSVKQGGAAPTPQPAGGWND